MVADELSPIKISSFKYISSNTSKVLSSPSSVIAITSPSISVIEPILVASEEAKFIDKRKNKNILKKISII